MLKKYIFYCIGVLLLAVAGIFGYTKWTEAREKVDLWTLVPADAVFVIESTHHEKLLKKLQDMDLWENLSSIHAIESISENISLLDSLSNRNNGTSRFLKHKTILTSAHVVGKKDFDFVFYIPINTVGEHRFMRSLIENINKSHLFKEQISDYQNYQLTSLTSQRDSENFTYFTYHNNLIVSANPDLVKEIIRNINHGQLESPAAEYQNINYLTQPEVFAHVFINYRYIPAFTATFLKPDLASDITYFSSLCRTSMLGFKQLKGELVLNGFSNPETLAGSLYNQVKGQKAQPFQIKEYLPNRTAMLLHFGLENIITARRIYAQDKAFTWPENQKLVADSLTKTFRSGIGVGYLETDKNKNKSEKIIFAQSGSPALSNNLLNALINQAGSNSIISERFGNYTIKNIPVKQLPLLLFGSIARDFETCFSTQVDNYFIFASSAAELKSVLSDIRAERVWAKTENQKLFLEHTQQEANFSLLFNTSLAWNMLNRYVKEDQRSGLLRHERLIKKFSQVALQFSQKENQYYTTFLITHPDGGTVANTPQEIFEIQKTIPFANTLISPPISVQTPDAGPPALFVQDAKFILHRLSNTGIISWSDSLQQEIKSGIYQVDAAKNNRPNYVFATSNTVQCLDGQGKTVDNFPFILPDTLQPEYLALLDLNQKKDYRLLISDARGYLVMLDMAGNPVSGWESKKLETSLAVAPQTYFVNGKNVVLALQKNGFVYAFNAYGDVYPGFPVALAAPIQSEAFVQLGATFRSSFLTLVTQSGEVITLNFNGQRLQKKRLPGVNQLSKFELIPDQSGESYIIAHQRPGKVSIYDKNLRLLLERNFITSSRKFVQFFEFGPLNKVYALTETGPQKTYLYNYQAQLIGQQPLDNKFPVALEFNANTNAYLLHTVKDKEVRKIVLKAP